MSDASSTQPPGWYYAQGDPPGTQRYWDGSQWQGGPQPVPGAAGAMPGAAAMVGGAVLSSAGKRIGARVIDGIIWFIVLAVIGVIFGAGAVATGGFDNNGVSFVTTLLITLIGTALIVAYEVFMIANLGGTAGKLALGMKVRKEDGSPADLNTAAMRMALYAGLNIVGFIPIIGIIASLASFAVFVVSLVFLFTDPRRQTLWDRVGKTIVVDA